MNAEIPPSAHPKPLGGHAVREAYLRFFEQEGHRIIPSAPLLPRDPSLLFVNSGMAPLKEYFLGATPPSPRLTSAQLSMRAGGKHNDLELVGPGLRHHTLFEMLGNFSFGDYGKAEAIEWAWRFLTEVLALPKARLWLTTHSDDSESRLLWKKISGFSDDRIIPLGDKSNFWQMGDTGPCGPCTEIFFDHGPQWEGGIPGSAEEDGPRYTEIWNLVFTSFDRQEDGTLNPLGRKCVDTGMGLERISAVLQGTADNYRTDLFAPLFEYLSTLTGQSLESLLGNTHARVLADHARACAFLVGQGLTPGREGAAYVLRRLMRRAIRHAGLLGAPQTLSALSLEAARVYQPLRGESFDSAFFPKIGEVVSEEESRFVQTLERGNATLESHFETLKREGKRILKGEWAFELYDTYGFPLEETLELSGERGFSVDLEGFERSMREQRERSKAHSGFTAKERTQELSGLPPTAFTGYDTLQGEARILAVLEDKDGLHPKDTLTQAQSGVVILDRTPFYAELGGQASDVGLIRSMRGVFEVLDVQQSGGVFLHFGRVKEGEISPGGEWQAEVNASVRKDTAVHHSATHLLLSALQKTLGSHVSQKGSRVNKDELRFDFSHPKGLSSSDIEAIECLVNEAIASGAAREVSLMRVEEAKRQGAAALFGEKYPEEVRVVRFEAPSLVSFELCGGTHIPNLGEALGFKILSEQALSSGIRRITAVAGRALLSHYTEVSRRYDKLIAHLGQENNAESRLVSLIEEVPMLESRLKRLGAELLSDKLKALPLSHPNLKAVHVTLQTPGGLKELKPVLSAGVPIVMLSAGVEGGRRYVVQSLGESAQGLAQKLHESLKGKGGGNAQSAQGLFETPDLKALTSALENALSGEVVEVALPL